MKAKVFLSLCFAACTTMAFAQLESKSAYSIDEVEAGWQGLRVSYKPIVMDVKDAGDLDMNGLSLDYVKSFRIGGNLPLFFETGAGFQWAMYSDKEEGDYEEIEISAMERWSVATINVPLNIAYQCSLSDKVTLTPFVGLNVKGHVLGRIAVIAKADILGEVIEEKEVVNLFSKDDMDDDACKRFGLGWHVGVNLAYSRYSLGVSYGSDFTEFATDTKFKTTAVTLGVNF